MGLRLPSHTQAVVTPQDSHSDLGALEGLLVGPEGKKSVGELLPLLWDYFYADSWDFLTVCRLRIPIFTPQDLAPSSSRK